MIKKKIRRGISLIIAACITLSFISISLVGVGALGTLPPKNTDPRHQVCVELSDAAEAYYTGDYSYESLSALSGAADVSTSYAAMQDNELFDALHALMTDTHQYYTTYSGYNAGSLAYFWASTDSVRDEDSYVMFYSDIPKNSEVQLNREHIWPKARASFYMTNGCADLHHLRPSASTVNIAKSDHTFGDINGVYTNGYTEGELNGEHIYYVSNDYDMFECKDDVKGDVARILLYVYCRWEQPNLYTAMAENLPEMDRDDTSNNGLKVIQSLDTLLNWCESDPVDTWEMTRNDLTEEVQGNRNVFIDYPELAWQMFGRELPVGMATPTHEGCQHQYELYSHTDPTCTVDGSNTFKCSLCGNEFTKRIAAPGHIDTDDDYCDVCGEPLAIMAEMTKATELKDGDHVAIYSPSTSTVVSHIATKNNKLTNIGATVRNGVYHPSEDCAVMTVSYANDGSFYLMRNGSYLTTRAEGGTLGFEAEPNEYSLWTMSPSGYDDTVFIDSVNAVKYNKVQRLQVYSGTVTTYGAGTTPAFRFELYTTDKHYWDEGVVTKEPTALEDGVLTRTCLLCGEHSDEPIDAVRLLGDTDGDGKITVNDVTEIQRYLAEYEMPAAFDLSAADTDESGTVTILDVTCLQRWLASYVSNENIGVKPV